MGKLSSVACVVAVVVCWLGLGSAAQAQDSISISWDGTSPQGGRNGLIKGSGPYTVTGMPVGTGSKVELTAATTGVVTTITRLTVMLDPCTGLQSFAFSRSNLPTDSYGIKITISYKDHNGVQQPDVTLIGSATCRP